MYQNSTLLNVKPVNRRLHFLWQGHAHYTPPMLCCC